MISVSWLYEVDPVLEWLLAPAADHDDFDALGSIEFNVRNMLSSEMYK